MTRGKDRGEYRQAAGAVAKVKKSVDVFPSRLLPGASSHAMTTGKKAKAYHEAGHAVVARLLGVGVDHASLSPINPGRHSANVLTDNAAWLADKNASSRIAALEKDAKIALAGMEAQYHYRPLTQGQMLRLGNKGWSGDWKNAMSFIVQASFLRRGEKEPAPNTEARLNETRAAETFDELKQLQAETRTLVKENWLAAALLSKPFLTQGELDILMAGD